MSKIANLILICLVLFCGCINKRVKREAENKRVTASWNKYVEGLSKIKSIKSTTGKEYQLDISSTDLEIHQNFEPRNTVLGSRYFGNLKVKITRQPDIIINYNISLFAVGYDEWTLHGGRALTGIRREFLSGNKDGGPSVREILNQLGIEYIVIR